MLDFGAWAGMLRGSCVPVAQLDRALASGAKGCGFDPRQAHHFFVPENFGRCQGFPGVAFGDLVAGGDGTEVPRSDMVRRGAKKGGVERKVARGGRGW